MYFSSEYDDRHEHFTGVELVYNHAITVSFLFVNIGSGH